LSYTLNTASQFKETKADQQPVIIGIRFEFVIYNGLPPLPEAIVKGGGGFWRGS